MKKRMQVLMSLTLSAFLFLGLTSLNAQSFTTGPTIYSGPNGKTLVDYQDGAVAINTIQTEIQTNFDALNPPTEATNPEQYFRGFYLRAVREAILSGDATAVAIYRGYNLTANAAKTNNPTLVNETWQDDMVTLLSN